MVLLALTYPRSIKEKKDPQVLLPITGITSICDLITIGIVPHNKFYGK